MKVHRANSDFCHKLKTAKCSTSLSRRCRRLFCPPTLFRQSMHTLMTNAAVNSDDPKHQQPQYDQMHETVPKHIYNQMLVYCIVNCIEIEKHMWMSIAARNGISSYILNQNVFSKWTWPHLTLEQSWLFRCYNWADGDTDLDEERNIVYKTTPYFLHVDSKVVAREDTLCPTCIKTVVCNDSNSNNVVSITKTLFRKRCKYSCEEFSMQLPYDPDLWCRLCKIQPLFSFNK